MSSLHIANETITNGYNIVVLDFLAILAIFCGIFVIVSKNPIVSLLFLIGLFLTISIYLITLGMNFIGLSYLLVYVGAVSILFLFILMLINVRISELSNETGNSLILAAFVLSLGLSLDKPAINLGLISLDTNDERCNNKNNNLDKLANTEEIPSYLDISHVTSNSWDGHLLDTSHITTIGNILYSSHSIWLILTSIILLLAMVGAIVITINVSNLKYEIYK
jgi:NADH-ubiquinone oxidoreductase chain 6